MTRIVILGATARLAQRYTGRQCQIPWRKFVHGNHIDLGRLRADRGNADYVVPNGADTDALSSVILCRERMIQRTGWAASKVP